MMMMTFLGLFRAVYSSKLPSGDGDRFLRDVVAADRYGLEDVRRLGEAGCATSDSADRSCGTSDGF